jgi:putative ABC transport system permease protein
VLATMLAGIGLYGVLAYSVALRSREFGLRIALGAPRSRIHGGILKQIAAIALPGIGLGVAAAWLLGRAARSLLFGVEAGSPVALGSAAAILVVVTFAASYLPARRASTIDPMVVLRYE